jgi:hypothetical protein
MKIEYVEGLKDRIRQLIVDEIQLTNIIAQQNSPQEYLPRFIEQLTSSIHILVLDEIIYRRK